MKAYEVRSVKVYGCVPLCGRRRGFGSGLTNGVWCVQLDLHACTGLQAHSLQSHITSISPSIPTSRKVKVECATAGPRMHWWAFIKGTHTYMLCTDMIRQIERRIDRQTNRQTDIHTLEGE